MLHFKINRRLNLRTFKHWFTILRGFIGYINDASNFNVKRLVQITAARMNTNGISGYVQIASRSLDFKKPKNSNPFHYLFAYVRYQV